MKTKLMIISILFLCFFAFSMNFQNINNGEINKKIIFYNPFDILFDSNSYHVMLYFKNHQEYESIEFMIKENIDKKNIIRGIITRHDGSQIDYFNDEEIVKNINKNNSNRETYFAQMYYKRSTVCFKDFINIKFKTIKGENIDFVFYAAAKPSSKYGGIIDPLSHSKNSSLPIMYREKSTLASPKSTISIDGKYYEIPVKVNIPIFFKGLEGYFSENFDMLIFKASKRVLNYIKMPGEFKKLNEWIYKDNEKEVAYKILDIKENSFLIKSDNEIIKSYFRDGIFFIEDIKGLLNITNKQFSIKFSPFLPLPINIDTNIDLNSKGFVNIYIDKIKLLSANITTICKDKNNFTIIINPTNPEWAKKRNLIINIEFKDSEILINSLIEE